MEVIEKVEVLLGSVIRNLGLLIYTVISLSEIGKLTESSLTFETLPSFSKILGYLLVYALLFIAGTLLISVSVREISKEASKYYFNLLIAYVISVVIGIIYFRMLYSLVSGSIEEAFFVILAIFVFISVLVLSVLMGYFTYKGHKTIATKANIGLLKISGIVWLIYYILGAIPFINIIAGIILYPIATILELIGFISLITK